MKFMDAQIDLGPPRGRVDWTFPYRGEVLTRAANAQTDYHETRRSFYAGEATRLEGELRDKGIEMREQAVTGGPQFTAVVDPVIGQQLAEARQRRDRHDASVRRFKTYAGAFTEQPDRTFHLTIEDVDYFALHREPGD
jgi:hypothetical protein